MFCWYLVTSGSIDGLFHTYKLVVSPVNIGEINQLTIVEITSGRTLEYSIHNFWVLNGYKTRCSMLLTDHC